jgi:ABC-type transporter Mla maintaining outer membrane lipid asymmetry ATPase subunit MlaF
VLRAVDLAIPAGQITGIIGPSGSGKSTMMRSIVGVQERVTGTVEVLGELRDLGISLALTVAVLVAGAATQRRRTP